MKLLLDTHALLWWLADDPQMGNATADLIEHPDSDVIVSVVSLWEIAIKHRIGKMEADAASIAAAANISGLRGLGVERAHLQIFAGLPLHHRDPFDHMLIAQAIAEDAAFVTVDRVAERYPVRIIACR